MTHADPFGLVGTTIGGRYAVEALVAEGGFSVVYRARHKLWNRPVAIKAIRGFEALNTDLRERLLQAFVREGAILAELSERTTAIVQARDAATLFTAAGDWVPYLVLEWLDGETLESVLWKERDRGARVRTLGEATNLLQPIARALACAHAKGICHRDLKPGNVVLIGDSRGPRCTGKLLDFGGAGFFTEARRTLAGPGRPTEACGFTPAYAAPEQFSEAYGITGPWTDVYALALLVVELATGREPMGEGTPEALARVAVDPKRRPTPRALGADVSDAVEEVLARALAVYPAERWQTAGSFWRALREALRASGDRPPVRAAPRPPRMAPPAMALAIAVLFGALAASDHGVNRRTHRAPRQVTAAIR
jgi:serine/threonine protein kinase